MARTKIKQNGEWVYTDNVIGASPPSPTPMVSSMELDVSTDCEELSDDFGYTYELVYAVTDEIAEELSNKLIIGAEVYHTIYDSCWMGLRYFEQYTPSKYSDVYPFEIRVETVIRQNRFSPILFSIVPNEGYMDMHDCLNVTPQKIRIYYIDIPTQGDA